MRMNGMEYIACEHMYVQKLVRRFLFSQMGKWGFTQRGDFFLEVSLKGGAYTSLSLVYIIHST